MFMMPGVGPQPVHDPPPGRVNRCVGNVHIVRRDHHRKADAQRVNECSVRCVGVAVRQHRLINNEDAEKRKVLQQHHVHRRLTLRVVCKERIGRQRIKEHVTENPTETLRVGDLEHYGFRFEFAQRQGCLAAAVAEIINDHPFPLVGAVAVDRDRHVVALLGHRAEFNIADIENDFADRNRSDCFPRAR